MAVDFKTGKPVICTAPAASMVATTKYLFSCIGGGCINT